MQQQEPLTRVRALVLERFLGRETWGRDEMWALLLEIGRAVFGEEEVAHWREAEEERAQREKRRHSEVRLR